MNGMKYESRKETEEKQLVEVVVLKRRRTLEKNNRETRGWNTRNTEEGEKERGEGERASIE